MSTDKKGIVFILEDDIGTLSLYEKLCNIGEFDYVSATDLQTAEALFTLHTPDIAILDMKIGEDISAGLKCVEWIDPSRCIIVSGYVSGSLVDRVGKLGISTFITKPFKMTFLLDVMRRKMIESKLLTELKKWEELNGNRQKVIGELVNLVNSRVGFQQNGGMHV